MTKSRGWLIRDLIKSRNLVRLSWCWAHLFMFIEPFSAAAKVLPLDPDRIAHPGNVERFQLRPEQKDQKIAELCDELKATFQRYGWKKACSDVAWKADLVSVNGYPLIYAEFGNKGESTILLGGVHPDELNPIPVAFYFAQHLHAHPEAYQGARVIVAPLVNPDGFLSVKHPTRTNANGVDINRNFLTHDWHAKARKLWRKRPLPRYFPGHLPNSEIETLFQIDLIERIHPAKVLSIHAPLGFLDLDGPGDRSRAFKGLLDQRSKGWVRSMSKKASNYRIVDYSVYPGSLGNFSGFERQIPTVTLELQTASPKKTEAYWRQFLPGMLASIRYTIGTQGQHAQHNAPAPGKTEAKKAGKKTQLEGG